MTRRRNNVNPVASFILACVLGVLCALAIAHWMASCWEAGPEAMCTLLAPALSGRSGLHTWWRRVAAWWAHLQMAETERQIAEVTGRL